MARLKDLGINVDVNLDYIVIQNVQIPITFTMSSMEFIADVYGEDYSIFEQDLNDMLLVDNGQQKKHIEANRQNMKIMRSLIYAMVRSAGTETTPQELERVITFSEVPAVYNRCMNVFLQQNFQEEDIKKSSAPQDHMASQKKRKRRRKKRPTTGTSS